MANNTRAGYLPTLASRQAVQAEFRFIRVGPGERSSEATGGIAKIPGFSIYSRDRPRRA